MPEIKHGPGFCTATACRPPPRVQTQKTAAESSGCLSMPADASGMSFLPAHDCSRRGRRFAAKRSRLCAADGRLPAAAAGIARMPGTCALRRPQRPRAGHAPAGMPRPSRRPRRSRYPAWRLQHVNHPRIAITGPQPPLPARHRMRTAVRADPSALRSCSLFPGSGPPERRQLTCRPPRAACRPLTLRHRKPGAVRSACACLQSRARACLRLHLQS